MSLKIGNIGISKGYLGSTEITKAYLGSVVVLEGGDTDSFITTWRTTTTNESITIPATGTYDISTSDGQTFTNVSGSQTITFPTAGDYDVTISNGITRINFQSNSVSNQKIIDIKQWGTAQWSSFNNAFFNCNDNMTISAIDVPNTSNVSDFRFCFFQVRNINVDVSQWDISNATNLASMLRRTKFNRSLANWNIVNVSNMLDIMDGVTTFSTANYNATLIGWVATLDAYVLAGNTYTLTPSTNFGTAVATGSGLTARNTLINTYGWSITDGTP